MSLGSNFLARLSKLWFLGTAEIRTCRRLTRTWEFIAIACIATLWQWVVLTDLYDYKSFVSPVYGLIGPRFTIAEMGGTMLFWFSVGVIFLAFDMRFRDTRDRMTEVLDKQPLSDIEMILGRLLGIVGLLAIPACIVVLLMFCYGMIAEAFSLALGTPMEPVSVFAFIVWDIIPNLVLWGSVTVLLSHLLRFRFLALCVALVLLGSFHVLSITLPFSVSSVLSTHTGVNTYPSELAPTFVNLNILVNRGIMLAIAAACIALAALLQSRNQSAKMFTQLLISGMGLMLGVSGLTSSLLIGNERLNEANVQNWTSIHKQVQSHSGTDVQTVSGAIDIRPGRSVSLDLTLTMEPPRDSSEDDWLFSLNPGYRIKEIAVNGEQASGYRFENGLLQVPRDDSILPPEVRIVAKGKPNKRFAYLDSSLDWKSLNAIGARRLFYLGQENYIFHPNYVALMPGISWIPTSGSAFGAGDFESRPRDFYFLDVTVSVPKGWLIAAPGSRDIVDSTRRSSYRFTTQNPIPEFTLISSNFEQRSMEFEGVEFELLFSRKHTKNLHAFEESTARIKDWISERSSLIHSSGLRYPYTRLSLVEVPTSLRTYGGGWRMDSVYSSPGVQMIRESGFPVASFADLYRSSADYLQEQNIDIHKAMLNTVITYFANDLHGGDPLVGIPRNFVDYQTAPTGNGATALRYLANELALRLTTKSLGYFSVYTALARGTGVETYHYTTSSNTFDIGVARSYRVNDWRSEYAARPSAWELLEQFPLSSIDYPSDPQNGFHALLLKIERVADAVIDTYGEELVTEFLAQLVERYRGRSYTEKNFQQTALDVGIDIDAAVGDWLNELGLAGFVVNDLKTERLPNIDGEAVHQTTFILGNRELVPGVVEVSYQAPAEKDSWWGDPILLDPVHVEGNSAVLVALQSGNPPTRIWLEPRLSLNREPIRLDVPELDSNTPSNSSILPYVTQVDWQPADRIGIIVDDLDVGFSVEVPTLETKKLTMPTWLVHAAAVPSQEFDRGLPVQKNSVNLLENRLNPLFGAVSQRLVSERIRMWHRDNDPTSFGEYRKTYAGKSGGLDQSKAIFSTILPAAGIWKLEYHIPISIRSEIPYDFVRSPFLSGYTSFSYDYLGTHTIHVLSSETQEEIEFDGGSALPGWNQQGTYELSNSKVDVVLTEVLDGYGVADAIRWTPL